MQIAQGNLIARLAAAAALSAALGFGAVAAHAQVTNPTQAPNVMGTTGATTSGSVTQGATQGQKAQEMKDAKKKGSDQAGDASAKADKKTKKAKPATQ